MAEIVEFIWDCRSCGAKGILGRHTSCPSCGASVPSNDAYYEPPRSAPVVTDPELLRLANAPANWRCAHCDGIERALDGRCSRCGGANKTTGWTRKPSRETLTGTGGPPAYPPPSTRGAYADATPPEAPPQNAVPRWGFAVGGAALAALLCLLAWGFSSHKVEAEVTARTWERSATVLTWGASTATGWLQHDHLVETPHVDPTEGRGERAGVENIRNCTTEVHHTDRVRTGSHEVCTVSDARPLWLYTIPAAEAESHGNGFGTRSSSSRSSSHSSPSSRPSVHVPTRHCTTVTDYASVPRFDERCTYTTWTWARGTPVVKSGLGDSEPSWPEPNVGALQKVARDDTYTVTWTYQGTEKETRTVPYQEYAQWPLRTSAVLTVNNFGSVTEVSHGP